MRLAPLLLLAACRGDDGFTPNNTTTFACEETAATCIANNEDPTCATTGADYMENACEDETFTTERGMCGDVEVWLTTEGQEQQWTLFDGNGAFLAIIGFGPSGAATCEVGPDRLNLLCNPPDIAFSIACPVP
ncbi:MAG TPA: hypothetical protein VGM88_06365 [Kofleriaceae bacterium]